MDVRVINSFLDGTVDVLSTMAFVKPKAGKAFLKKDNTAKGDISGIIGFTGTVRGSMAISFGATCIQKIVSNMLGEQINSIDGDIKDAVGEITNMVSGAARKKLEGLGFKVNASIPTVVYGREHSIMHVLGGPSIVIPFETEDGNFFVDFCIGNSDK